MSDGQLVIGNPARDISNLQNDSIQVSKNEKGMSGFLRFPGGNYEGKSKFSNRTEGLDFFDGSSGDQIINI